LVCSSSSSLAVLRGIATVTGAEFDFEVTTD
jgi:hypothetical protein